MKTVTTHEAKTRLSQLIDQALNGERVVICRGRKPVVTLAPIAEREPRDPLIPYPDLACIEIRCDLTAPLSESEWPEDLR
jgi:antitoxin (DNA-binding transcriptional repressor) of toxin-antitoxin stability system